MLTTAIDIPSEDTIAGFRSCLDPEVVLSACRDQLVGVEESVRTTWRHARLVEALYHPQRYLRVVYALLDNPKLPANRLWPEGQLVYLNAPLRKPMSRRGTAVTIAGVEVEAYCFPNDRRLRGLRRFALRESTVQVWQRWIDQRGGGFRIDPASLQRLLVRYVPEQKWLIRLRAEGGTPSSGSPTKRRIAVRCTSPIVCATLLERHNVLVEQLTGREGAFCVPSVVGVSEDRSLLAVEWLRGRSLLDTLQTDDADWVMGEMAKRLGALHAVDMDVLQPISPEHLAGRARSAGEDLALSDPKLSTQVRGLTKELQNRLARLRCPSPVTLHNDFHWNQVSIKRNRFALLDLERMAIGDPLIDVANFAMQLQMLADRSEHGVDPKDAQRWRASFLEHWARGNGGSIDTERFACFSALSCLELARGMMRHLRPGWPKLAQRCLDVADAELSATGREVGSP